MGRDGVGRVGPAAPPPAAGAEVRLNRDALHVCGDLLTVRLHVQLVVVLKEEACARWGLWNIYVVTTCASAPMYLMYCRKDSGGGGL